MKSMNFGKYQPYPAMGLRGRQWPDKVITAAPVWCSVDLRDGNQALSVPMGLEAKTELFSTLVKVGFKEIEIGFPSASAVEFEFARKLIDGGLIPEDVTVQVLVQAREHLIRKTFEAIKGVKRAIVHIYNSTSAAQREMVFNKDKAQVKAIAVDGAKLIKRLIDEENRPGLRVEYSPESFTGTEMDYALEVCEAVLEALGASAANPVILNLPATVEMTTPNVYADQIEWFCGRLKDRGSAIVSLHTHNDRGTAIAAAELGVMAGADRVEGTLFGNGERTGNLDIMAMAMNLFSRGVDPKLDFNDIRGLVDTYEKCTGMEVHPRHPYAGDLVYTAFSGSHQDAINKGLTCWRAGSRPFWDVPYLPIDPADVGRQYEPIIRINSQSGKGGIAFIMSSEFGYRLPKAMWPDFADSVQKIADSKGVELSAAEIKSSFDKEYLLDPPYKLQEFRIVKDAYREDSTEEEKRQVSVSAVIKVGDKLVPFKEKGNGPLNAFANGVKKAFNVAFTLRSYDEHALKSGSDAKAVCYICLDFDGKAVWGAGLDSDIAIASIKAVLSCLGRREL